MEVKQIDKYYGGYCFNYIAKDDGTSKVSFQLQKKHLQNL